MPVEITKPATLDELEDWLTFHGDDIPIAVHRPNGYHRTDLAALERFDPAAGERWREVFRVRWLEDGWLPALASVISAAARRGDPLIYVPRGAARG